MAFHMNEEWRGMRLVWIEKMKIDNGYDQDVHWSNKDQINVHT